MALKIESGTGTAIPEYVHKKHYDFLQNGALAAGDQLETTKWCSLKNAGIASCFHRIRILSGSTVLEDLLDYPTLYRLATEMTSSSDHRDHSHLLLEGVGDAKNEDHKRIRRSNNSGKIFVTRLLSGILQSGKYLPLHLMGALTIEIYMARNTEALLSSCKADGLAEYPAAKYEISDVFAECQFVKFSDDYEQSMLQHVQTNGLQIHFSSFDQHSRNLNSFSSGNVDVQFSQRSTSLKGCLSVFRDADAINDIRQEISFPAHHVVQWQYRVGSTYYPSQPVEIKANSGALSFMEAQKVWGSFGSVQDTGTINADNYYRKEIPIVGGKTYSLNEEEINYESALPNHFNISMSFERSPGQLSGLNSVSQNADVELRMKFDGTAWQVPKVRRQETVDMKRANVMFHLTQPTAVRLFAFMFFDSILHLERVGVVSISK